MYPLIKTIKFEIRKNFMTCYTTKYFLLTHDGFQSSELGLQIMKTSINAFLDICHT